MKIGAKKTTGWKATISVAMSNYIEAGSIIAIATSLGFWQDEFGISNFRRTAGRTQRQRIRCRRRRRDRRPSL